MSETHQKGPGARPVAIVTGGLQGLGLGAVVELGRSGFDVAIVDLPEAPDMPPELAEVEAAGGRTLYYAMDISDLARHGSVLDAIAADFGRLDCLVNNAGIAARPLTDLLDLQPDAFDTSVDINLRGTFFLTQAFAKALLAAGETAPESYKSIIIITSIAAELSFTDRSQYCVTKSALSMVTKLFAARLGAAGIHVHEIRPGLMETPMTAKVGNDTIARLIADGVVPLPRQGQPEDVGKTVAALATGALPYMTGQPIWTAGGLNIPRIL
ncbi:3-ketoacyl-ACP reductase [Sphingobium subterraneum]|uniref:NAD(P)-dependent dehydrogenase (Short-subunit alcohol dehydrogenase family) n=1 Tax=Sphingobium subterraneum TaxID=627688 RepID=A0A841IY88_9SPHN|nr:3-ketoacyl-ACP reductase [Sphingobium subterraneum]MBB6123623.1 NAD(P)-dependent dehydrogenase (short-subunit alcohol dehydrogenase family) [Sphingobium subterraneum]